MHSSLFTLTLVLSISTNAFSQEGKDRNKHYDEDGFEIISNEPDPILIKAINDSYLTNVKPIFKIKCLNCHGTGNALPWYASIPGPKQLVQYDIREAKEHMDMSKDFPFAGHGRAKDDLEALSKTIQKETMPPLRYKLLHWNSSLSKKEQNIIQKWINESLRQLTNPKEERK